MKSNLIVIFGKDEALCSSFLRESKNKFVGIDYILHNLDNVYVQHLFHSSADGIYIRAISRHLKMLITHYVKRIFH